MSRVLPARLAPTRLLPYRWGGGAFAAVVDFEYVTGPTQLSNPTHTLRQGDTRPSYVTQLLGADGTVQDITGCAIVLSARRLGTTTKLIDRRACVDAAITALPNAIRCDFITADTLRDGTYDLEVELTGPDSGILTFPNGGVGTLTITPQIG